MLEYMKRPVCVYSALLSLAALLLVEDARAQRAIDSTIEDRLLEQQQVEVQRPPAVRFAWTMPPRLEKSWAAWNGKSYDLDYVYPSSWPVTFDLCSSSGRGSRIEAFGLTVQGAGFDYLVSLDRSACRFVIDLPRLGKYKVQVRVETEDGRSASRTEVIEIRDRVIAIIGDSMSSGEGNPDQPGDYKVSIDWLNTGAWVPYIEVTGVIREVGWKDRRCHRSALSGPVLAARALEAKDPHSSITLIDLACSGAEIVNGLLDPYDGIEPDFVQRFDGVADHRDIELRPQVAVLEDLVGANAARGGRRIDALLMSIGVNDIRFAGIIFDCARNISPGSPRDCLEKFDTAENIARLENSYAKLAERLGQELDVSEVYIAPYPPDPIGYEGCGWLDYPAPDVSVSHMESVWINRAGRRLNAMIRAAARAHGWNYVEGMSLAFDGHAYCDDPTYFIGLTESVEDQGIVHGALHPNRTGHEEYKALLLDAIVLRPQFPHRRVTITITQMRFGAKNSAVQNQIRIPRTAADTSRAGSGHSGSKIAARKARPFQSAEQLPTHPRLAVPENPPPPPPPPPDGVAVSVRFLRNQYSIGGMGVAHRFTIPESQLGQWVDLPGDEFTSTLDVYPAPASPRHAVTAGFTAAAGDRQLNGGCHPAADNYGEGMHQVNHPTGWSIRYTIQVERLLAPAVHEMQNAGFKTRR